VLVKSLAEERDIGVRRSLGATPLRVLRHVVGSNLRGVLAGLALALLLAGALVRLTRAFPIPTRVPFEFRPVLTVEAAAIAGGLTILATLLASVLGWRRALRGPEFAWLRTAQVALPATASRLRGFLAAGQVALATLLASHALLVMATLRKLERSDLGFDPDRVVTFDLMFSETRFPHDRQRAAFVDTLLDQVRTIPGVAAAGASTYVPLENRLVTRRLEIPGYLRSTPAARYSSVTPGLFEALRLRLLEGRGFDEGDSTSGRRVAIVNEAFARRYLPEGRAIGSSFTVLDEPTSGTMEVVGIVADVAQNGVDVAPAPMLYVPFDQEPQLWFSLVVRSTVETAPIAGAVRSELRRLDPLTAASAPRTMEERIADGTAPWRLAGVVMGAVAAIGLTLAMTGTYVVASYGAALREREFGLRQALGASPREIALLVLGGSARVAALGASVGLLASLGLSRAWESWLHGTGSTPLGVSVAVSVGVIAAALLLTLMPAVRAMRTAPALVLARG
jgi:predicted permease